MAKDFTHVGGEAGKGRKVLRKSGMRGPGISPLGRALIVLLVYFTVWLSASSFGNIGAPVPLLWAYLPLLLLIGAGLALLRRRAL